METVPGGCYKDAQGDGYHDANGEPVSAEVVAQYLELVAKRDKAAAPAQTIAPIGPALTPEQQVRLDAEKQRQLEADALARHDLANTQQGRGRTEQTPTRVPTITEQAATDKRAKG